MKKRTVKILRFAGILPMAYICVISAIPVYIILGVNMFEKLERYVENSIRE